MLMAKTIQNHKGRATVDGQILKSYEYQTNKSKASTTAGHLNLQYKLNQYQNEKAKKKKQLKGFFGDCGEYVSLCQNPQNMYSVLNVGELHPFKVR